MGEWLENLKRSIRRWHYWYNPYCYWWQVRKYVKRPTAHLYYYKESMWDPRHNKWFSISSQGLGWKSKWDEPRHESDPWIALNLFGKTWQWRFNWITNKSTDSDIQSMATWEMILYIVCWYKSVGEAEALNHWDEGKIRPLDNLTELGKKEVLQYESMCNERPSRESSEG